jgi:entericidin B
MKKIIALIGVMTFAVGLSACNTFKGMGKDVERGGEKVQDAASGAQQKN